MLTWLNRGGWAACLWGGRLKAPAATGILVTAVCLAAWFEGDAPVLAQVPVPRPEADGGQATPDRFLPRTPARDLINRAKGQPTAPPVEGDKAPLPPPSALPDVPMMRMPLAPANRLTAGANKYIKQINSAENVLEVIIGRPQVYDLNKCPGRMQIGDETIANQALLSPNELSLQGLKVGATALNMWFPDPATGKTELVSFIVRVLPDPDARARLDRAYKHLEGEINRTFPNSRVTLGLVGDKLVVSGQARDVAEVNMIMRLVQSNVLPEAADSPEMARPPDDPANYYRVTAAYHRQVVNMIRVIGEQQVMLQVQVVEVNRAAARSIGLNFAAFRNNGSSFVGGTTGNLAQTATAFSPFAGGAASLGLTGLGGIPNLPVALDFGQIQFAIAALRNLSYARYLAEPNLVAINGQKASFQVGSLFPVPVVTGNSGGGGLQGVSYIPTGVQLAFTPYITDRDRIRLTINAEISDRDVNVGPTMIDGAAVPSLVTRNFQTTVELREGQTMAVAGLIESKLDTDSSRLPFFWCVPILNRLAGYDRTGNREKEMVVLVTPRLVRPLDCKDLPPTLPGMDLLEPTDFEFYALGRLESHTGSDFRSPIRTDKSRVGQFRWMEQTMLIGPSGPSEALPFDVPSPYQPVPAAPPTPFGPLPPGALPFGDLPSPKFAAEPVLGGRKPAAETSPVPPPAPLALPPAPVPVRKYTDMK